MQERLFRLAYEAVAIGAYRTECGRWQLVVTMRRGDETFADAPQDVYNALTTSELADVLEACARQLLT